MKQDKILERLETIKNQIENDYINGINWVERYIKPIKRLIEDIKKDEKN